MQVIGDYAMDQPARSTGIGRYQSAHCQVLVPGSFDRQMLIVLSGEIGEFGHFHARLDGNQRPAGIIIKYLVHVACRNNDRRSLIRQ